LKPFLSPSPIYSGQQGGLGALSDPAGGGTFNAATSTFTESAVVTGNPTPASQILNRLVYTAPALANGASVTVNAAVSVNGVADPKDPIALETVTAPSIAGTVANQPIASGATLRPFATVQVNDVNFGYSAKPLASIRITDNGVATDADGLLTGPGLSKIGVGTYTITSPYSFGLQSNLANLVFTPAAVGAGATRTTGFELYVNDAAAGLATDDTTTSVLTIGTPLTLTPPLIAGTSGTQTVAPGNAISPFNGITISDANANPLDSATLTVSGGGTLGGAGLISTGGNVYTIAATSPAALTATLNALTFVAPPLGSQTSVVSTIKLDVVDGQQTASDSKTAITEMATPLAPPVIPPTTGGSGTQPGTGGGNFTIADQTTGQQTFASGDTYTGPVPGIADQFILITPDNLNISSAIPNVFIHSGSGTDALDVSRANGNNILDGSTGSNFLTGGTGIDTFYLDDRSPTSDVFSTIVNFHSGDNATIFGVNPTDFKVNFLDNQGAVGAKGLDYAFTAPGKANANLVIAGYTTADLNNGRLTATYGTTADLPGLPGSQYLNIHAN